MNTEDVPVAWTVRGQSAAVDYANTNGISINLADLGSCVDAIIAAVYPLIVAQEREACAALIEAGRTVHQPGHGGGTTTGLRWHNDDAAAAIRARTAP